MTRHAVISIVVAAALSACNGSSPTPPSDNSAKAPAEPTPHSPAPPAPSQETPPSTGFNPSAPSKPADPAPADQQSVTLHGMLVTGLVGIGGEHTGWGLEPDDKSATVELNVSAVFDTAKDLAGSHVTAKGHYIEKKYVERGKTRIFVVTSIARADR